MPRCPREMVTGSRTWNTRTNYGDGPSCGQAHKKDEGEQERSDRNDESTDARGAPPASKSPKVPQKAPEPAIHDGHIIDSTRPLRRAVDQPRARTLGPGKPCHFLALQCQSAERDI